ncbi:MAG: cytochrome c [Cyanophyceae cyanobacterium]
MSDAHKSDRQPKFLGMTRKILVTAAVFLTVIALWLTWPFLTNRGPVYYADIDEHFRYGSVGGENTDGIPYWLWKALPVVFADKLPGEGWTSLGFIQEPDHELPIGFAKSTRTIGLDVVTQNCATCHVSTLRETPESQPAIVSTMPANTVNLQAYIQFLINAAIDERFTASQIMPTIAAMGANLNPLEKLVYKYFAIPQTRDALLRERHDLTFMEKQSSYGPGRVDTFTTYKTRRFGFPADELPPEELNGIADFPSIWNQEPRQGLYLHWDGNNNDPDERNRTAALALVAPATLDFDSLFRLQEWLNEVPPPEYPYRIDAALAARGQPIFEAQCASCHDILHRPDKSDLETVTPIDQIGTDRGRLDSYTYDLASNQYLIFSGIEYRGEDKRFRHYRKTNGYANAPLDGIWLRAPYLHNGSVPTLRDLLEKPEARPKTFFRGYDVYDKRNVGFISTVPAEDGKPFFKYDTSLPGNGNGGHLFGTDLSAEDKEALLEYLKTQ